MVRGMNGRMTMTVDGTPVSDADIARMQAEEQLHSEWQRRTVRVVAAAASDAQDCRMLLSILGLDDQVVAQARAELPKAGVRTVRKARGRTKSNAPAAKTARRARSHAA
jgi:hypothetical protein